LQFLDEVHFPVEHRAVARMNRGTVRLLYPLMMAANYASIWILGLVCAQVVFEI
jgi:hypothetical protein